MVSVDKTEAKICSYALKTMATTPAPTEATLISKHMENMTTSRSCNRKKGKWKRGGRVLKKITYSHNYHKSKTTGKALHIFIIHRKIELDKSGTNECSKIVSNGNIGENCLACKFSFDIERPKLNNKKKLISL